MSAELILASKSPFRAQILANAGIIAETCAADIDERLLEAEFLGERSEADAGRAAPLLAAHLAQAKALEVSRKFKNAYVIGCDQILALNGAILHKAANEEEARARLAALSGRTHSLHTAFTIARGGKALKSCAEEARLTMRELTAADIDAYLKRSDKSILQSVGVYQIEGAGIRLFEAINGQYWTIIGLPLLPLLGALRELGAIPI